MTFYAIFFWIFIGFVLGAGSMFFLWIYAITIEVKKGNATWKGLIDANTR
jgi:hypothetical protein